jgi:hypothetical protein
MPDNRECYYEEYIDADGRERRLRLDPTGEWCEHVAPGLWFYVTSDSVPPELRKRGELSIANAEHQARCKASPECSCSPSCSGGCKCSR